MTNQNGLELKEKFNFRKSVFEELADEKIVAIAKKGIKNSNCAAIEHLLEKYKPLVKNRANRYFLPGAERDDLIQEGMLGLWEAICGYNKEKNVPFSVFAELCVTRNIIDAVKNSTRKKHSPLNFYTSFNHSVYPDNKTWIKSEEIITLEEIISENGEELSLVEESIISKKEIDEIKRYLKETIFTELEFNAVKLRIEGASYKEIAKVLNRHVKSIDNALKRVREKMNRQLITKKKISSPIADENLIYQTKFAIKKNIMSRDEMILILQEHLNKKLLDKQETKVVRLYIKGKTFQKIANVLNCEKREIENIIYRIKRRKLNNSSKRKIRKKNKN